MKYHTAAEIKQMKLSGYDPSIVREIEEAHEKVEAVCRLIAAAFDGVALGNGVGLYEAQGHDECASDKRCAEYRASDEKDDWLKISAEALNECHSSLSFFDAEGMRFHLAAFLIADIKEQFHHGMLFCLSYANSYHKFSLLSQHQHQAVRGYLIHAMNDLEHEFYHPDVLRALDEYWT